MRESVSIRLKFINYSDSNESNMNVMIKKLVTFNVFECHLVSVLSKSLILYF